MKQLKQTGDMIPVYWVVVGGWIADLQVQFPDTVFHSVADAVKGIGRTEFDTREATPVTGDLLRRNAEWSSIVLTMMDRLDPGGSFSFAERRRHYSRLLGYWSSVLRRFAPDLVLFPETPHMVYDYVLYILCRQQKVPTLMFGTVNQLGRVVPMHHYDTGFGVIGEECSRLDPGAVDLPGDLEQHLSDLGKDYAAAKPKYLDRWEARNSPKKMHSERHQLRQFKQYPRYAAGLIRANYNKIGDALTQALGRRPAPENYLKLKGRTIEESGMSGQEWYKYKKLARRKKQELREYYEQRCRQIEPGVPYVFAALHYQPEKTTSPEGGLYVQQELMVENIARKLPAGWVLYVKENPLQFQPNASHGERSREMWFYGDMLALDNVRFLALDSDPFVTLDGAKAVATVTSSIGWEALVRGKPVLVFGYAWYAYCPGAYRIQDEADLVDALCSVEQGSAADSVCTRRYLRALHNVSFAGYTNKLNKTMTNTTENQNTLHYVRSIKKQLQNSAVFDSAQHARTNPHIARRRTSS